MALLCAIDLETGEGCEGRLVEENLLFGEGASLLEGAMPGPAGITTSRQTPQMHSFP